MRSQANQLDESDGSLPQSELEGGVSAWGMLIGCLGAMVTVATAA